MGWTGKDGEGKEGVREPEKWEMRKAWVFEGTEVGIGVGRLGKGQAMRCL
jgi:hypothetical protein